ncbi:DUF6397 family protein [Streptomyces sp. NPDC058662]|uniref:DUF6397 family protein n=1 Tax=Streptomyces sp. NPDC058662 TaxID=3346583 RepID=UPI00364C52A1
MRKLDTVLRDETTELAGAGERAETRLNGVRAAAELGLTRSEFARAVQLGIVRAGPPAPGGGARYTRAELERVRSAEERRDGPVRDSPVGDSSTGDESTGDEPTGDGSAAGAGSGGERPAAELRARVEAVAGAQAAADVLGIGPSRFTRLARCGRVSPVGYRVNRYRAVVWLYLASELREFAAREPAALRGAAPPQDRELMAAGADLRPRRWRGRHVGLLLRRTADPWERAAVLACVLPGEELVQAVPDPAERVVLAALAPPPPYGHPQVPEAAAVARRLLTAEAPEEVHWYRTSLDFALRGARGQAKSTGERGPT